MAHGFAGYQDARNNKGYTAAFNKMVWNRGVPLAKKGAGQAWGFGKELYQKLKDKFGKRKNQSVALVAQHSSQEVVPVSVHQVGNTSSIFGGKGISRSLGGGAGGITNNGPKQTSSNNDSTVASQNDLDDDIPF